MIIRVDDSNPYVVKFTGSTFEYPVDNKPKKIIIEPLDSGFKVTVGCKEIAVTTAEILCKHLLEYLKNPSEMQKKLSDGKLKF